MTNANTVTSRFPYLPIRVNVDGTTYEGDALLTMASVSSLASSPLRTCTAASLVLICEQELVGVAGVLPE